MTTASHRHASTRTSPSLSSSLMACEASTKSWSGARRGGATPEACAVGPAPGLCDMSSSHMSSVGFAPPVTAPPVRCRFRPACSPQPVGSTPPSPPPAPAPVPAPAPAPVPAPVAAAAGKLGASCDRPSPTDNAESPPNKPCMTSLRVRSPGLGAGSRGRLGGGPPRDPDVTLDAPRLAADPAPYADL